MGKILDLSKYQLDIDFAKLAEDHKNGLLDGVIIRVQAGFTYPDPKYKEYVAGCKKYGIPFGTYAYFEGISVPDSIKEAENAYTLTDPESEVFAVDIEAATMSDLVSGGQAFVDCLRGHGVRNIGLYSGEYFYKSNNLAAIKVDWTWIANYGANDGQPHTPPSIAEADLWQFTSVAHVDGISTEVDESVVVPSADFNFFKDHTIMTPVSVSAKPLMVVRVECETDVRAEPSHTSGYIGNVHAGQIFNVWDHAGDFLLIIFDVEKNIVGWVDGNGGKNLYWLDNPALNVAPAPQYYLIQSGDMLFKIANKFGTSIAQLKAWNGIQDENKIYAGQKIRVK
jgi:GH25 family lysozyme M1 (1,4-beta-N-acetylmuramidase)